MEVNLDIIREGVCVEVKHVLQEHFDKPPKSAEFAVSLLSQFAEACIVFVVQSIDITLINTHEDVEDCTKQCVKNIYSAIRCILGQYSVLI